MMTLRSAFQISTIGLFMVALFLNWGCSAQHKQDMKEAEQRAKSSDDYWPSETHSWQQIADAQAAAGAQDDASLSSDCFTGGKLNSLGREKLRLVLQSGSSSVLYLGGNDDATNNLRRSAIDAYLKETGAGTDSLVVKSGFNPRTSTLARENISRLPRTESTGAETAGHDVNAGTGARGGTSTSSGGGSQ